MGILFPMAFLGKLWPDFGSVFDAIFSPDWMHIVMHTFLYAVLGILLTTWIKSLSIQSVLFILGLALLVGCFHEGLQILTARQWPGWFAEIFDLSVDLAGAAIGLALARF
jgi:VanZ family protein